MSIPSVIPTDRTTLANKRPNWTVAAMLVVAAVAALLLLFHQTTQSTVALWES